MKITGDTDIDCSVMIAIFVGSGVYQWLPGKGLQEFIAARLSHYAAAGEIKSCLPALREKSGSLLYVRRRPHWYQ